MLLIHFDEPKFILAVFYRRCTHSAPARSNWVAAPLLERIDEQQQKTEIDIQGVGKGHHKMIANCVHSKPMISRSQTSVRSTQSSCRGKETSFIETGKPDHGCKNSVEKSFSGYKHSSLRASQTRPHTVASESVDQTQQMTKGTLRRTLSNPKWNNSLMRSENGDVQYYRPMSLSARRRRTKSVQSEKPRQPETDPTKPQPIKHGRSTDNLNYFIQIFYCNTNDFLVCKLKNYFLCTLLESATQELTQSSAINCFAEKDGRDSSIENVFFLLL